jgi:hypothetical protein
MNQIRLAKSNDTNEIMKFVNDNWKENHILARDKDFFVYEHNDKNIVNFIISLEDNKINGVLGFIKYSDNKSDVATVIWKALKNDSSPMLGIELLEFLRSYKKYNTVFSLGINKKTIGIYHYLDIHTGHLSQYIIINKNIQNFNILKIKDDKSINETTFIENTQYSLVELEESGLDFDFDNQTFIPYKDKNYFIKRYFNHPIYDYTVHGIYKDGLLTSLIVTREVVVGSSKILRIMDYLGDEKDILHITYYLHQMALNESYEYIDFMCYGFDNKDLERAGFLKINLESTEIITPNYFSPFAQENITINFMADTKEVDKLRICKADGDQDRPN